MMTSLEEAASARKSRRNSVDICFLDLLSAQTQSTNTWNSTRPAGTASRREPASQAVCHFKMHGVFCVPDAEHGRMPPLPLPWNRPAAAAADLRRPAPVMIYWPTRSINDHAKAN
jgi:hypothetical protein